MPRPRKTEAQRRAERFGERYRVGKARLGATEKQIGNILGIERPALLARRKDPGKLSVDQLVTLGKVFNWSDDDFIAIIRPETKDR